MGANARTAPPRSGSAWPRHVTPRLARLHSTGCNAVHCSVCAMNFSRLLVGVFVNRRWRCKRARLHRACRTKFVPPVRMGGATPRGAMRAAVRVVSFRRRARRPAAALALLASRQAGTALSALAAPSGT